MPIPTRKRREQGLVSLEYVLMLPLIVFTILFFIGMAYTLGLKQNALVAARYSAFMKFHNDGATPNGAAGAEVHKAANTTISNGSAPWTLTYAEGASAAPSANTGDNGGNQDFMSSLTGAFNDLIMAVVPGGTMSYTASATVSKGWFAKWSAYGQIGKASSRYTLPRKTWTCTDTGGSGLLGLLLDKFPDALKSVLGASDCCPYVP